MNIKHIKSHPFFNSLYIEFKTTTDYIHSIRRINDSDSSRVEPYEPSMFIYSFFTFNTLYNIDLSQTCDRHFKDIIYMDNVSERKQISTYLSFIWNGNTDEVLASEFNKTVIIIIRQYLSAKGENINSARIPKWIDDQMLDFIVSPDQDDSDPHCYETKKAVIKFIKTISNSLNRNRISYDGIKHVCNVIYSVRCNLFHGAKDPNTFDQMHQKERFVIYAAILTAINKLLFLTIEKKLSECAH